MHSLGRVAECPSVGNSHSVFRSFLISRCHVATCSAHVPPCDDSQQTGVVMYYFPFRTCVATTHALACSVAYRGILHPSQCRSVVVYIPLHNKREGVYSSSQHKSVVVVQSVVVDGVLHCKWLHIFCMMSTHPVLLHYEYCCTHYTYTITACSGMLCKCVLSLLAE